MPKEVKENTPKQWDAYYDRAIGRGHFKINRPIINKIKHILENQSHIKTVLELGSGNGELCLLLRKVLKLKSFGIDWSNKIVDWNNRRVSKELFKCKDINKLPKKLFDKFDCIVANESLEYIGSKVLKKVKEETLCIVVLSELKETFETLKSELKDMGFRETNKEDLKEEVQEVNPELLKRIYVRGIKKQ